MWHEGKGDRELCSSWLVPEGVTLLSDVFLSILYLFILIWFLIGVSVGQTNILRSVENLILPSSESSKRPKWIQTTLAFTVGAFGYSLPFLSILALE